MKHPCRRFPYSCHRCCDFFHFMHLCLFDWRPLRTDICGERFSGALLPFLLFPLCFGRWACSLRHWLPYFRSGALACGRLLVLLPRGAHARGASVAPCHSHTTTAHGPFRAHSVFAFHERHSTPTSSMMPLSIILSRNYVNHLKNSHAHHR